MLPSFKREVAALPRDGAQALVVRPAPGLAPEAAMRGG